MQTVYDFRWKNKHRINVIIAEWSDTFSDLWIVKKHARIADAMSDYMSLCRHQQEMLDDAWAQTEIMRRVDPDAVPVRVDRAEWRATLREKCRLDSRLRSRWARMWRRCLPCFTVLSGPASRLKYAGLGRDINGPAPIHEGPQPYVEPKPVKLSAAERWEQQQNEARERIIRESGDKWEAEYKAAHPNWQAEEEAGRKAFAERFIAVEARLLADDAYRLEVAREYGPGWYDQVRRR